MRGFEDLLQKQQRCYLTLHSKKLVLCFASSNISNTVRDFKKKKSKRWCMSCLILKKLHSIPFSSILSSAEILDFSLALKIVDPLKKNTFNVS